MRHWPAPIMQSTEAQILDVARFADRLREGSHPENRNYIADILDGLVTLFEVEGDADEEYYAAEKIADAAANLRDQKEEVLA